MPTRSSITVVLATRNRSSRAVGTVRRLRALPEQPPVIVVDDGSTDGTADALRAELPDASVITLPERRGVTVARNAGVAAATTEYVAFSDDDSWWGPGALTTITQAFENHPRLGLIAARILIGEDERLDPTCTAMAASPLPSRGLPGPGVLGFVACGAAVRRQAFLDVGGFPDRYVIGGEEEPLAFALAAAGWNLAYLEQAAAHHHPATQSRNNDARDRNITRNDLWTAWTYRRGRGAIAQTMAIVRRADTAAKRAGLLDAARQLPHVLRHRRPLPHHVERQRRLLDGVAPTTMSETVATG